MVVETTGCAARLIGQTAKAGYKAFKYAKAAVNFTRNQKYLRSSAKVIEQGVAQPGLVKGWKLGDPINNLTRAGNVPKWSTTQNRYWKNEAFYHPERYSIENLARMKRGRAPQEIFFNKLQSMELNELAVCSISLKFHHGNTLQWINSEG